jgi:hypothetical protein
VRHINCSKREQELEQNKAGTRQNTAEATTTTPASCSNNAKTDCSFLFQEAAGELSAASSSTQVGVFQVPWIAALLASGDDQCGRLPSHCLSILLAIVLTRFNDLWKKIAHTLTDILCLTVIDSLLTVNCSALTRFNDLWRKKIADTPH